MSEENILARTGKWDSSTNMGFLCGSFDVGGELNLLHFVKSAHLLL